MSNATQRRERKLAQDLRELATNNPERFKHEWRLMLDRWSLEAIRRGQLQRNGHEAARHLPVFDILAKAKRVIAMCGEDAERLVGATTRELLSHDCSKAFALGVEPGMYKLGNTGSGCDLIKNGTHKPPR
jgi:hypothetical protein